jgi:hypothetical protein
MNTGKSNLPKIFNQIIFNWLTLKNSLLQINIKTFQDDNIYWKTKNIRSYSKFTM